MSNRIYYEIDGRVKGPVSFIQLQMMATSGVLHPEHKVRLEDTNTWVLAKQVRNLFDPPAPVAAIAPSSPSSDGGYLPEPSSEVPGHLSAFDFFSDAPASEPPDDTKKKAKGDTRIKVPAVPSPASEPAEFGEALPVEEVAPDAREPIPIDKAPTATTKLPTQPENSKPASVPESKPGSKMEVRVTPPEDAPPGMLAEVLGQAVELLPNDCARLQDGRVTFRLFREHMLAGTKFTDGTVRNVYLRLARIDTATIEQRLATRRNKGGPFLTLSFAAGATVISMAAPNAEKQFRIFLEKVLETANAVRDR